MEYGALEQMQISSIYTESRIHYEPRKDHIGRHIQRCWKIVFLVTLCRKTKNKRKAQLKIDGGS